MRTRFTTVLAALCLSACATAQLPAAGPSTVAQADLDRLAREIGYRFEIVDNQPADCPAEMEQCFLSTITLAMPETLPPGIAEGGFALYYSFPHRLPVVESDIFQNELVNGDLQRLTLKPGAQIEPGGRYTIQLWGTGHYYSTAFAMPNSYLAAEGLAARTIEATRPVIDPATGLETLPFVAPMTDEARLATASEEDMTRWLTPERAFDLYASRGAATAPDIIILPTPLKAERPAGEPVDISGGVTLHLSGIERPAIAAALQALPMEDTGSGPALRIVVDPQSGIGPEGYRLRVGDGAIAIQAADEAGASHALRSLAQQAAFEQGVLRPLAIEDSPRFPFRGLHIDVARNFHSKAELLKLVDAMAAYKLNKLHLHLADDEGWRIEIKALPELTGVGAVRCHDPSERTCLLPQLGAGPEGTGPVNGYLSQADYIEIVKAADARQIEVVPSLDMPGHSRAAIVAMEARYDRLMAEGKPAEAARFRLVEPRDTTEYRSIQNYDDNTLNVCIEPTYAFLDTAVDEIAAMHRAAGAPLKTFHIGADETAGAWSGSPACQPLMRQTGLEAPALTSHFIERVSRDLAAKGITVGGWSDGMGHTDPAKMPEQVQSNIWGGLFTGGVAEAHTQANRGWDIVLSIPDLGYLDMPYAPHPLEGGYDWASRGVSNFQVFGFMLENLPANAALIRDMMAKGKTIEDKVPLDPGRGIVGLQGQLWSETIRTDAAVDYMLFPRLIALAERAWHEAEWEPAYQPGASYGWEDARVDRAALLTDWRDFAGRMAAQFPMLDAAGIAYRLAPPGARIVDGRLEANSEFPGLGIEYRAAGGEWTRYQGPVAVSGPVELRTRTPDGRRTSRTVTIE